MSVVGGADISLSSSPAADSPRTDITFRFRLFFWLLMIFFGVVQCWAHRNDMNPDGISYIEIAENAAGGSWHALVNGYWSPLYPFLIGIALRIFHPVPQSEFAVVHGVNFFLFLASFACFEIFLCELIASSRLLNALGEQYRAPAPRTLWTWGCLLFLWSSRFWLGTELVSPDLFVAAVVFLATAVLLRMSRDECGFALYLGLGALLGLGYLSKAVMFPLSFVFLGCALALSVFFCGLNSKSVSRVVLAFAVFVFVACPFIVVLSKAKSRITSGDTGKINYAEFVNRATNSVHWQGDQPGTGTPLHPTRKILQDPPIYEFAAPISGSYPPWYDPSYWYAGITPHFSIRNQAMALYRSANGYLKLISKSGALYFVFLGLLLLGKKMGAWEKVTKAQWLVFLPSIAALTLYSLVLVENRYVGPFVLMIVVWTFARLKIAVNANPKHLKLAHTLILVGPLLAVTWAVARDLGDVVKSPKFEQWDVARGLHEMGVPVGAPVGYVGNGLQAYWAHLAGVRIIAELPQQAQPTFLSVDDTKRRQLCEKFGEAGAISIVMKAVDKNLTMDGWQEIGETPYYLHRLPNGLSKP